MDSLRRALPGSALATPRGRTGFVLLCAGVLAAAFLCETLLLRDRPPAALGAAALAWFAGLGMAVPTVLFLFWVDRRERESPLVLAAVFLAGAAVSPGVAVLLGAAQVDLLAGVVHVEGLGQPSAPGLAAAQELAKAGVVLLVFWFLHAEFDDALDGVVYGGFAGLGFALTETALLAAQGGAPPLELAAWTMPLCGLGGHVLWTALAGAGLGLARQAESAAARVLAPCLLLVSAVLFHTLQDAIGYPASAGIAGGGGVGAILAASWMIALIVQAPALAMLAAVIHAGEVWELRVIREALRDEVGTPSVTEGEYADILRERPYRQRSGPPPLVNAQDELAFRKWHVLREGGDPDADPAVLAWRADLRGMRGSSGVG